MKEKKQTLENRYVAPNIDVVEMEPEQAILAGSGEGDGNLNDMTGDFW